VAHGAGLPCVGHMEERRCVAHVEALRVGHTGEQRCVDRVETLPCAAHVEARRCVWVPAITEAFGTALGGATGGAGGGHMASAHAGVGLKSATFGSAECSNDCRGLLRGHSYGSQWLDCTFARGRRNRLQSVGEYARHKSCAWAAQADAIEAFTNAESFKCDWVALSPRPAPGA
jgi:hypothetical protein